MKRFIHIPKNGGTSIVMFCQEYKIPLLYGVPKKGTSFFTKKHSTYEDWKNEDSEKFAVIRNPLTRLVSWYQYLSKLGAYSCTFSEFVIYKLEPKSNVVKTPSPWTPQYNWVCDNNKLGAITLFVFESINSSIPQYFGVKKSLQVSNITNYDNQDLIEWYDHQTKTLVEDHFAKDVDLWNSLRQVETC